MRDEIFIRDARREDAMDIATLYQLSGGGVADYLWSLLQSDYPGHSLVEIGAKQYERTSTDYSYQNCFIADYHGEVTGMIHCYPVTEPLPPCNDPIIQPFCEFEHINDAIGSLYISGIAVHDIHRSQGIGSMLIKSAYDRARNFGLAKLSLIAFEQNTRAVELYKRLGFSEIDRNQVVPHEFFQYSGDILLMTADT